MRNLTTELKVGLLILGGIALIVYSSIVVTGWRPGQSDTYSVYVHMDNVAGLLEGSPVQVSGIKIGEVREIELVDNRARLRLEVYKRYRLYSDSKATIKSLGILGDKYIDVNPGTPTQVPLKEGDTIIFVIPGSDLDSLVDTAAVILRDVQAVTGTLRDTLGGDPGRERLNALLDELVAAAANLNKFTIVLERVMRDNEQTLGRTAGNLEDATGGLRRIIEDNESGLQSIVNKLEGFSGNIERISADNEAGLREIVGSLNRFTTNIERITAENEQGIKQTIDNLAGFSAELEALVAENRQALDTIVAQFGTFTDALATDGPEITGNARGILEENRTLLKSSIANLDRSFEKLDATMSNLNQVTGKLERGEGTIGKLINDETTVEELNSALTGINKFLTDLNRLKLDIGGHVEYLTSQQEYKSYLTVKLQPLKNRWYVIQLVDNPRGHITRRTIQKSTSGTSTEDTTTEEVETTDELQFSILINQRYFDTVLRGGLMESSFGIGVEQLFGADDQYSVGLDVWDFSNEFGPHAKVTALWRFYSNAFVLVGYDDFLSEREEFRDAFFGVGVNFNEDSLKPLFSSLPISSVSGQ